MSKKLEIAVFGGGCFWSVEEAFRVLPGVIETASGYMGDAIYEGGTGRAEVVKVDFDPEEISYKSLLAVFWKSHNPTELNRQGPNVGPEYRSVLFYGSDEQKLLAEASLARLEKSGRYEKKIVTQIVPVKKFYKAEDYHQKFLAKRGLGGCHL